METLDDLLPNFRLKVMVDGVDVTEGAKEMWDEIGGDKHPDLDWKSFYSGFAAGKMNLLKSMNKDASVIIDVEPKNKNNEN